jgi:hypothetical protein
MHGRLKDIEGRLRPKINLIRVSEENEGEASIQNWKISSTLLIWEAQKSHKK